MVKTLTGFERVVFSSVCTPHDEIVPRAKAMELVESCWLEKIPVDLLFDANVHHMLGQCSNIKERGYELTQLYYKPINVIGWYFGLQWRTS
jgi:hypothetical protein